MKNRKIIGTVLFVGGALIALKTMGGKKVTIKEIQETSGQSGVPFTALGIGAAALGLYLVLKKD